jgi:hypothetical protein
VLQAWWQNASVAIEVVDISKNATTSQFLTKIAMLRCPHTQHYSAK